MDSTLRFFGFSTPNSSKVEVPLAESTAIPSSPQNDVSRGKRRTISPLSSKHVQRMRIEPHVITDAQSSGIVSRLVKYYDQSQTDAAERSRIVYNKVGDFPIVQLKKNEIKRSFSRATSVRIPPPNRTIMNRDLRAAIMRSNSFQFSSGIPKIQPVKMRAKDDSHQIITNHEPLSEEAYPASANSVLDALEKNCRKRINNEELILDRTKKFCSPIAPSYDYIENASNTPQVNLTPHSAKRLREPVSPNRRVPSFDFEQRTKRLRTKNNALLSSLSSSHYELIPSSPPGTPQANQVKAPPKYQIYHSTAVSKPPPEKKMEEKEKTPVEEESDEEEEEEVIDAPQELPKPQAEVPKKLQLFNRKPDPNSRVNRAKLNLCDSDDEEEIHVKFVKPREKAIEGHDDRKAIEQAKLNRMLNCLTKRTDSPFKPKEKPKDTVDAPKPENPPAASISFSTSTTTTIVAPISSAEVVTVASSAIQSSAPSSFQLPTGISQAISKPDEKSTETAPKINLVLPQVSTVVSTSESEKEKVSAAAIQTTSSLPQFSFGSTQSSAGIQSKAPISFGNLPSIGIAKESEKPLVIPALSASSAAPEKPSLGGFQFGLSKPSESQQPSSKPNPQPVTKPVSPLALFTTSAVPATTQFTAPTQSVGIESKIATTTASGIGFSFGGKNVTSTITGIRPISSASESSSFNFGSKPAVPTTAPPSFNFGPSSSSVTTAAPKQAEDKPSFSFGGSAIASVPPNQKLEAPKSSFSFGVQASTPIFGQMSSGSSSTPATTASSFNFGSVSSLPVTSAPTFGQLSSTPSFSSLNVVPSTAPPTFGTFTAPATTSSSTGSIFGSVTANSASQAPSVFGGFNSNQSSSNPFASSTAPAFGQAPEAPKSSFSFAASNPAPAAAPSSNPSIFGSSSQAQSKPSFNFGGNAAAAPSFGSINSAPTQEPKSAFNFSSSSSAPSAFGVQPAASAPVFGSNQSPFGASQESQKPAFNFNNPTSAFNFNKPQEAQFGSMPQQISQSAPLLPQLSPAQGSMFNIGTAGQQQQRKPFRTATRRLK